MVQVDVFWSYGLASGLALAAQKKLKNEPKPFSSPYFTSIVVWTSLVFAPSGAYLLWAFPYWETMFVARTHTDIPAWLTATFAATNVSQAILGYWVTWWCLRRGKNLAAKLQTVWSHGAMLFILAFGWDGSGWKRFTYAGNGDDWANGVVYPWTDFFSCPVFYTLLGMGVVFIPTYFGLIWRWTKDEGQEAQSVATSLELSAESRT